MIEIASVTNTMSDSGLANALGSLIAAHPELQTSAPWYGTDDFRAPMPPMMSSQAAAVISVVRHPGNVLQIKMRNGFAISQPVINDIVASLTT